VPVVKDGKIVGIVSRANLIQALVTLGTGIKPSASANDSALRANLLGQLQSKAWWTNNINIIVKDGVVELWGFVDSPAARDAIRVAAEVTPGVRQVSNNLTVETRPSAQ
jgi:osmotically-inducible protein OsmY